MHVDLSNCEGEISLGGAYHLKWLEQRLATKIQEGHRLDVLSAVDLFREVDRFLRTQSSNEVYLSMFMVQHRGMMSFYDIVYFVKSHQVSAFPASWLIWSCM